MVNMYTPSSALDEKEMKMRKAYIADQKSMLLMNLKAKERQLYTGAAFHPEMTQNTVRDLHDELGKLDAEYKEISRLQKTYRHHVWKMKWSSKCSRFFSCACFT